MSVKQRPFELEIGRASKLSTPIYETPSGHTGAGDYTYVTKYTF